MIEENQGASFDGDNQQYKHWNIFFKDIYRVNIDIVDRDTNVVISHQDLEHLLHGAGGAGQLRVSNDILNGQLKIYFVLKIYYQINDSDESGETGEVGGASARSGIRGART